MIKKPNFFLIGAPKCGTSAMRTYLAKHPEVYFSIPDEPGYFDGTLRFARKKEYLFNSDEEYLKLFQHAELPRHKIRAEGSVYIMYTSLAISQILNMSPDAKFLVMLRDPIDAFVSMHGENLKSPKLGREPFSDLIDAWQDLPRRKNVLEMAGVHPFRFRYDVLFSYAEPIKFLKKIIPPDQLKIVIYDDFVKDNISVFREVCAFLNIDQKFVPNIQRINERSQSRKNIIANLIGIAAQTARWLPFLKKFRGRGLTLNRFTQQPLAKPIMTDDFFAQLRFFFHEDVCNLETLIDRDLSSWRRTDNHYK